MITAEQLAKEQSNGHSLFGASGWKQKLLCAGSTLAEIGLPNKSSFEAAEGTVAHGVAEFMLNYGIEKQDYRDVPTKIVDQEGYQVALDASMVEYVCQYVDWCNELPGQHFVETHVDLSDWTPIPNQGGTADHAACEFHHLTITDLKYGTGVKVYAYRNPQGAGYALGFIKEWDWLYDFKKITIRICQPRLGHFDVWEVTREELEAFGREIKAGLLRTWTPDAPRTPSEAACRFCRARVGCPAFVAIAERLADDTFDDETVRDDELRETVARVLPAKVSFPDPATLTTEQLAKFLRWRKVFEDTFRDVHNELQRRLAAGEEVEDWGIFQGSRQRSVASRAKVIDFAEMCGIDKTKLFETNFLSPAKLEELFVKELKIGKKRVERLLEPYIDVFDGGPVLALKGPGKKPPVDLSSESFEDETGQSDDL